MPGGVPEGSWPVEVCADAKGKGREVRRCRTLGELAIGSSSSIPTTDPVREGGSLPLASPESDYWIFVPASYDASHMTPTKLFVWRVRRRQRRRHTASSEAAGVLGPDLDQAKVLAAIANVKTHFNIAPRQRSSAATRRAATSPIPAIDAAVAGVRATGTTRRPSPRRVEFSARPARRGRTSGARGDGSADRRRLSADPGRAAGQPLRRPGSGCPGRTPTSGPTCCPHRRRLGLARVVRLSRASAIATRCRRTAPRRRLGAAPSPPPGSLAISRRVSAGSITSSSSNRVAALSALACSWAWATIASSRSARSVSSAIASSSRRKPSLTAPSSPIAPSSAVGQPTVSSGSCRLPAAIAWAPSP